MILKHIGSEYSEAKFYDITPKISVINPLVIELFIGEPLIIEDDMEIGVLLEDQVTIEDISIQDFADEMLVLFNSAVIEDKVNVYQNNFQES